MKIDLIRVKDRPGAWNNPRQQRLHVTRSLPFFHRPGNYVHRVRSAMVFNYDGEHTHTAVTFWCGNTGFISADKRRRGGGSPGHFIPEVPETALVCATCEGRAIGAGVVGTPVINGRMVKFSPRV